MHQGLVSLSKSRVSYLIVLLLSIFIMAAPLCAAPSGRAPVSQGIQLKTGSLHYNLLALARYYHWKLVWDLGPLDYQWIGKLQINKTSSVDSQLRKILAPYPLQAKLYQGNRVILIRRAGV